MSGFDVWAEVARAEEEAASRKAAFFGLERSIPARLRHSRFAPDGRLEPLRRWLGYKLYAVVYWLLRGHA